MRLGLVVRGSLDMPSGGFLYDRMLVDWLRRCGDHVEVISIPGRKYAACLAQNLDGELRRTLSSFAGDLLLVDELCHPSLFLVNRWLRRRRTIPIVALVHLLRSSQPWAAPGRPIYRPIERAFLASVDGFIFNSKTTLRAVESILGRPAGGVVATPGGDRFGEAFAEGEIVRRTACEGPLKVLFAANLLPTKGLLTVLKALSEVPAAQWLLTVAGSPSVDPRYAAAARRFVHARGLAFRVRFAGHLESEGMASAYRKHHLLAVPSSYEGFGIVFLEAMGFGVVPVGTTAGAPREIIEHDRSGFLLEPGDAGGLAAIISRLAADRTLLCFHALQARRRFDSFPTWEQSMERARKYLVDLAGTEGH
jgi:glycosyltransferase involved in cell wall biosynthesis